MGRRGLEGDAGETDVLLNVVVMLPLLTLLFGALVGRDSSSGWNVWPAALAAAVTALVGGVVYARLRHRRPPVIDLEAAR